MTGVYCSHTMLTLLNVVVTVKERSYEMTFGSRYHAGGRGETTRQCTMLEWTMQLGRDVRMKWGDPVDVVNGIQPCPFV